MPVSIKSLVANSGLVALTFKQKLDSVEDAGVPIFPPTYPAPERGQHRFDTPYTVNETKEGTRICDLDSVQSQANRMEAAFTSDLGNLVPQHMVQAGNHRIALTELPHRIADASIRATDLAGDIREGMLAISAGDPAPLAAIAPTSLIYGVWDSRDTQVKLPRAVRSEIRAYDVSVFTRSAQFTGAFPKEALGIEDKNWEKKGEHGAAGVGFAPTPSVDAHGGILVHGEIIHTASVLLNVLRKYRTTDGSDILPNYLLGLTLGGLLVGGRDYNLRSGCCLVPAAPAEWQTVDRNGERQSIEVDENAVINELHVGAEAWAACVSIRLGGEPVAHEYDANSGRAMFPRSKE